MTNYMDHWLDATPTPRKDTLTWVEGMRREHVRSDNAVIQAAQELHIITQVLTEILIELRTRR